MLPIFIDIFGFAVAYLLVMELYVIGEKSKTHSLLFRLASSFFAYACVLFFSDYVLHLLILTVLIVVDADVSAGIGWIGLLLFTTVLVRFYFFYEEKLQMTEMINFGWTAMRFGNYFRLRDADTRERIGTHKMKTIYEEVHGKPFTDDVLATPFDQQVTKFKKVPIEALKDTVRKPPPEYDAEMASLKEKQATDVTVSFRFELFGNNAHAYLLFMEKWVINPVDRELVIDIIFPSEKKNIEDSPAEQSRLVERIYESLHVLIAQEFFRFYEPYISFIAVRCGRKEFNDAMVEETRPVLRFRISLHHLRQRASRITPESEIRRIAAVEFIHHQ